MKTLLIGSGFAGTHLQKALQQRGHEVCVADLPAVAASIPGVLPIDIGEPETIRNLFRKFMPDRIFLLAAISSVAFSWEKPELTVGVNVIGPLNVLSAMKEIVPESRLIYIGSGEEYGTQHLERQSFSEKTNCNPKNPYAVSKFAAGQLLRLLAVRDHLDVVHLRPCNHFGPGQKEGFVVSDFCSQIVKIERKLIDPVIKVGYLDAKRDFLFVEDIIDAYVRIAEAARLPHSVYNLTSSRTYSIREILDLLLAMSPSSIKVEINPAKFRPVDIPVPILSGQRANKDFHWAPAHTLKDALSITLDWWRNRQA